MLTFHRYQKGKKGVVWVLKKELSLRLLSGHVDSRVVVQCVFVHQNAAAFCCSRLIFPKFQQFFTLPSNIQGFFQINTQGQGIYTC